MTYVINNMTDSLDPTNPNHEKFISTFLRKLQQRLPGNFEQQLAQ